MLISPAFAQAAGSAAPGAAAGPMNYIIGFAPYLLLFVAGWFLLLRPQQKRAAAHAAAIGAVKKGDQVVTAGGVVGRITKVEDRFVELEIAANTRIRVVKATLAEVTAPAKPAND